MKMNITQQPSFILITNFDLSYEDEALFLYSFVTQDDQIFYNSRHRVSTKPVVPVSNMFHVHMERTKEKLEEILVGVYEETGVGLTSYLREVTKTSCYFEVSIGDLYEKVPKVQLEKAFHLLDVLLKEN